MRSTQHLQQISYCPTRDRFANTDQLIVTNPITLLIGKKRTNLNEESPLPARYVCGFCSMDGSRTEAYKYENTGGGTSVLRSLTPREFQRPICSWAWGTCICRT